MQPAGQAGACSAVPVTEPPSARYTTGGADAGAVLTATAVDGAPDGVPDAGAAVAGADGAAEVRPAPTTVEVALWQPTTQTAKAAASAAVVSKEPVT
jgi:hypothetical protein